MILMQVVKGKVLRSGGKIGYWIALPAVTAGLFSPSVSPAQVGPAPAWGRCVCTYSVNGTAPDFPRAALPGGVWTFYRTWEECVVVQTGFCLVPSVRVLFDDATKEVSRFEQQIEHVAGCFSKAPAQLDLGPSPTGGRWIDVGLRAECSPKPPFPELELRLPEEIETRDPVVPGPLTHARLKENDPVDIRLIEELARSTRNLRRDPARLPLESPALRTIYTAGGLAMGATMIVAGAVAFRVGAGVHGIARALPAAAAEQNRAAVPAAELLERTPDSRQRRALLLNHLTRYEEWVAAPVEELIPEYLERLAEAGRDTLRIEPLSEAKTYRDLRRADELDLLRSLLLARYRGHRRDYIDGRGGLPEWPASFKRKKIWALHLGDVLARTEPAFQRIRGAAPGPAP